MLQRVFFFLDPTQFFFSFPLAMATDNSSVTNTSISLVSDTTQETSTLISFNASQLPIKLSNTNYPSWKAQIDALLFGFDLLGYLDGTKPCPSTTIVDKEKTIPNPKYLFWMLQDKLLMHGLISSLIDPISSLVASSTTSHETW